MENGIIGLEGMARQWLTGMIHNLQINSPYLNIKPNLLRYSLEFKING